MASIREFQKLAHDVAIDKGFWENPASLPELIALMHSELSEALEEYRDGHLADEVYYNGEKPEGVGVEFADCFIRILDACEHLNIDLETLTNKKIRYNMTRDYKHGGKLL